MSTASTQVERRVGQRFPFQLPVSLRAIANGAECVGITQDVSSCGVFLLTDASLRENDEIELTLTMPAEVTLGENMRVRCRGRVLRLIKAANQISEARHELTAETAPARHALAAETKIGVAVRLNGYEYLPDSPSLAALPRVAVLHARHEEEGANFHPR